MTLVERIAKLCSEQGTTMTAIERENGLSVSSIRKWDDHAPTIPKLVIVAKALNTTVSYLIGETDEKSPPPEKGAGQIRTIVILRYNLRDATTLSRTCAISCAIIGQSASKTDTASYTSAAW